MTTDTFRVMTLAEMKEYARKNPLPPPIGTEGGVTFKPARIKLICSGGWVGQELDTSLRLAYHLSYKLGAKTIYINTLAEHHTVLRRLESITGDKKRENPNLDFLTLLNENTGTELRDYLFLLGESGYRVLILNSFEFAALTTSQKRILGSALRLAANKYMMSVIVFTSRKAEHLSPESLRSGAVGWLASIAEQVIDFRVKHPLLERLYGILNPPEREVMAQCMRIPDDEKPTEKQPEAIQINNLRGQKPHDDPMKTIIRPPAVLQTSLTG